jgi:hypothetical protein
MLLYPSCILCVPVMTMDVLCHEADLPIRQLISTTLKWQATVVPPSGLRCFMWSVASI